MAGFRHAPMDDRTIGTLEIHHLPETWNVWILSQKLLGRIILFLIGIGSAKVDVRSHLPVSSILFTSQTKLIVA